MNHYLLYDSLYVFVYRAQLQQEKKLREDAERQRFELEDRLKRYELDIEEHKLGQDHVICYTIHIFIFALDKFVCG